MAPAAAAWWTVDDRTTPDAVILMASYDPLQNLEELIEESAFETNAAARRTLVDQTLSGLLDGRHYPVPRRLTTRSGQLIDQALPCPPGPAEWATTLAGGRTVHHSLAAQRGLESAAVELRFRIVR